MVLNRLVAQRLANAVRLRQQNKITSVHPTQVKSWKKQLLTEGPTVFGQNTVQQLREQATREAELYEQIGRLKMKLEWLKKKAAQFD